MLAGSGNVTALSPAPLPSAATNGILPSPTPIPTPTLTVPIVPVPVPGATTAPTLPGQTEQDSPEVEQQRQQYEQQQADVQAQMADYYAQYGAQALQLSSSDGRFTWPELSTTISQPFGCTTFLLEPSNPDCPTKHWHTGVDVVGPDGTPVFAAASGIIRTFPGTVGYGNFAIIIHSDHYATLYGHLQAFTVQDGDQVKKGDVIGLEGSTGFSTGPHLHFEIRHDNDYVDPLPFFIATPNTGATTAPPGAVFPDRKDRNLKRF
jgi:murein DD-endopeptidase MepM/ murein hydrolase activator NlpD